MAARRMVALVVTLVLGVVAACTEDDGGVVEGGPSATTAAPATTADAADPMEDASTTPTSQVIDGEVALLTHVRVAAHEGFDRVVFEFQGDEAPGYRVGYADGPVRQDGSGEVVEIDGAHALEIVMTPASGVDLSGEDAVETYTGPDRLEGDTSEIVEVVRVGDFEAVLSWALGTRERARFRVQRLSDPARLVVDLAQD